MTVYHFEQIFSSNQYQLFDEIDSTSAYIKRTYPHLSLPFICRSYSQSASYGQHQRHWESLPGGLFFSMAFRLLSPIHKSSALSQKLIISIHKVLSKFTQQKISLKWPNDLYIGEGKMAGLLIEVLKNEQEQTDICIGFGMNIKKSLDCCAQEPNSDYSSYMASVENEVLFKALALSWVETLDQAPLDKLTLSEQLYWQQHDYFSIDETVRLSQHQTSLPLVAIYKGLDCTGQAIIQHDDNNICYHSGSLSIRKYLYKE